MTSAATGGAGAGAVLLRGRAGSTRQRRELQQMAADLRILQEQTQLLQNAARSPSPTR